MLNLTSNIELWYNHPRLCFKDVNQMQNTNFPTFSRETYKAVKKMDREQMETFFRNVYDMGKNSNQEAVVDFSELRKRLSEIKGIGEKRLDIIMETVEAYLMEGAVEDSKE